MKPFDLNELRSRVKLHFRIHRALDTIALTGGDVRFRFDSLHSREREAMVRIIDGRPNKTIARQLGVSHRTANRIRAAVFKNMGVESAADLATIVARCADPGTHS